MRGPTPGPYAIDGTQIVSTTSWFIEPDEAWGDEGVPTRVIDCCSAMGGEDAGADQRLLAASWEMQELLKESLAVLEHPHKTEKDRIAYADKVRALLNKI